MYRDFLAAGNEGMQHWSSWPENYDEIYQRALATGCTVGEEGDSPRAVSFISAMRAIPAR
jgi:NADPH2:quinone reductase